VSYISVVTRAHTHMLHDVIAWQVGLHAIDLRDGERERDIRIPRTQHNANDIYGSNIPHTWDQVD
jgi:hypothetical protein